jgi:Fic family protein
MSVRQLNELEKEQEELELRRIAGKSNTIEINDRTLESYRQEFRKKGLEVESKDYPQDDFIQMQS